MEACAWIEGIGGASEAVLNAHILLSLQALSCWRGLRESREERV